jgi:hypothetical protein
VSDEPPVVVVVVVLELWASPGAVKATSNAAPITYFLIGVLLLTAAEQRQAGSQVSFRTRFMEQPRAKRDPRASPVTIKRTTAALLALVDLWRTTWVRRLLGFCLGGTLLQCRLGFLARFDVVDRPGFLAT